MQAKPAKPSPFFLFMKNPGSYTFVRVPFLKCQVVILANSNTHRNAIPSRRKMV